jgi:hypothetical protein
MLSSARHILYYMREWIWYGKCLVFSENTASFYGTEHADEFAPEELLRMLDSENYLEIYVSHAAIRRRKLREALETLERIALYDDDLGLQEEALATIRAIGGRKALDILRSLKSTEHKTFIEHELRV